MWVQAAALFLTALTRDFGWWLLASLLLGLGTAMVYPSLIAAVSDASHPSWRARSLSVYRFWRDLGYAIGALSAGLIADFFGLAMGNRRHRRTDLRFRDGPGAADAGALARPGLAERDEAAGVLVPQHQLDAAQAFENSDAADVAQFGMIAQHLRQPVERHRARQMVHMVDADVSGEPAEHGGKLVVGAAVQRRVLEIPVFGLRPVGVLELVLDEEQPDARGGRHKGDRQLTMRNGQIPSSQINTIAGTAMPRFVAMVETQGCAPARMRPSGNRYWQRKTQAGPMPNITTG